MQNTFQIFFFNNFCPLSQLFPLLIILNHIQTLESAVFRLVIYPFKGMIFTSHYFPETNLHQLSCHPEKWQFSLFHQVCDSAIQRSRVPTSLFMIHDMLRGFRSSYNYWRLYWYQEIALIMSCFNTCKSVATILFTSMTKGQFSLLRNLMWWDCWQKLLYISRPSILHPHADCNIFLPPWQLFFMFPIYF